MLTTTFEQIKHGMELAFFASAYADLREDEGNPMRGEIMDQLPHITDPAAVNAAKVLIMDMQTANRSVPKCLDNTGCCTIQSIYAHAQELYDRKDADRELTPEMFGHYCAMQAMGTGVGLESFGSDVRDIIKVTYLEFGSHSLQYDYD
jgi:hypothetical protein